MDRKAFGPEFVKRATGMFSGLRRIVDWPPMLGERERDEKKKTFELS
jgi:hypothetical protein